LLIGLVVLPDDVYVLRLIFLDFMLGDKMAKALFLRSGKEILFLFSQFQKKEGLTSSSDTPKEEQF
jgi:hypothetical protein